MSMHTGTIEGFAEVFHHYYSALAPDFGCSQEKPDWDELPANERRRLIAATRLALMETESHRRPYESTQPLGCVSEGRECGC